MNCEVISIGDELLIGQTINTNASWIGEQINILGFTEESGMLHTQMSGSCSGCASSTETLKMGVESTLMHFIEEIKGVTSEDDPMFSDPYYMSDPGMMDFPPDDH